MKRDFGTALRARGTTHWARRLGFVLPVGLALTMQIAGGLPAQAGKPGAGGTSCSKRTPCDTTPPSVTISTPGSGSTVSGTVTAKGTASDNAALSKVQVKVDSGAAALATGAASWTDSIDTTVLANGSHVVTAIATDASGNATSANVTVNVNNAPPPPLPPSPSPSPTPSSSGNPVAAPAMAPGTIGGYIFQESDRDGVYEVGESPLTNQHLYLYDGSGAYVTNKYSDASGWFAFSGLADGSYRVQLAPDSWWGIRADWVPDTTGSYVPILDVQLNGTVRADMGWRPIVRSTSATAPLSSYTGSNGIIVQSFDDVVAAQQVYDALMVGTMVGSEAQNVTLRFDFTATGSTSTMAVMTNGVYTSFHATSNVSWTSWLDSGDRTLFHEYGHAWSLYYAYMVQDDPAFTAYLKARGVYGDSRLGTSYMWDPKEMIAEDYRQLFGSANAQTGAQINTDLPLAKDVPGLKDFLSTTFRAPPA